MAKKAVPKGHTGQTESGHTRDLKVERIGRVTIYKRGKSYSVYYREKGRSVRRRVEGNLNSARQMASSVNHALEESRPSPLRFERIPIPELIESYLDQCRHVRGLAPNTLDRYQSALSHFVRFAGTRDDATTACDVDIRLVEEFVKWMRQQSRARNGRATGVSKPYRASGIKFILSTCRSTFNWALKRRFLPPYSENPFSELPLDAFDRHERRAPKMLTSKQQEAFFEKCDPWQKRIFLMLVVYGLRVGELTHLLISDVDWEGGTLQIQSKPEMVWHVKTRDQRVLPVLPQIQEVLEACRGNRKAGVLFLNRPHAEGGAVLPEILSSSAAFLKRLQALQDSEEDEKARRRSIRAYLRGMGQIPEKRIRQEFMKLTTAIGCPELTRAHSLRHLFSTRAQEQGMNPLLVQGLLGHADISMTQRYTHFGMDTKRKAVGEMLTGDPVLNGILNGGAAD
jgi:integrase